MEMEEKDVNQDEKESKDPGAARFGNFINYYSFNPPENRLKSIPDNLLTLIDSDSPICILDIGCNAGDLTAALYESLSKNSGEQIRMLGVDLDDKLVDRAVTNFTIKDKLEFQPIDIMSETFKDDIGQYLQKYNKTKFDLVTVFSVTMWVHLNHGDLGLIEFIKRLCSISQNVLVEPQPWKCYQTAARRMRKLGKQEFEEMKNLKFRGPGVDQEIVNLFVKEGLNIVADFGESKWNRKLILFKHQTLD